LAYQNASNCKVNTLSLLTHTIITLTAAFREGWGW